MFPSDLFDLAGHWLVDNYAFPGQQILTIGAALYYLIVTAPGS
jgi:hypothetical protein